MSVKRDYGNFSKAVRKMLPALVAPQGYADLGDGFFARQRDGWLEGFGLQQSHSGDGDFCINMGIHVPRLDLRWADPQPDGHALSISFRLSERGADQGD